MREMLPRDVAEGGEVGRGFVGDSAYFGLILDSGAGDVGESGRDPLAFSNDSELWAVSRGWSSDDLRLIMADMTD